MINFGTSAYLKLLSLNPKPRDTEIRKRLTASGGGYDFHKAMRRLATSFASGGATLSDTETALRAIKKPAERRSAKLATEALAAWVGSNQIRLLADCERRAMSPAGLFSVRFTPDFEVDWAGHTTRVHLWNTLKPDIGLREAIGTLGLFVDEKQEGRLAILSLQSLELFVAQPGRSARELAERLARDVDRRIGMVSDELARSHRKEAEIGKRISF